MKYRPHVYYYIFHCDIIYYVIKYYDEWYQMASNVI